MLHNKCYKIFSIKYNKTAILNKITLSKKYTLECFINDLKQHELHSNILKFIAIYKQNKKEIMFIHEYASDGTLRQYLKQNSSKFNWNDKLRLARQLVNAIKYFHENDMIHTNLNSEKVFIHKGDIKIAFQYQNESLNIFKYLQYMDPQYLQDIEVYKFNKSSDIYSIGILLWEISSCIIPFEKEVPCNYYLLNAIIHGKREIAVSGTPKNYVKIFTECWQNDSSQRPTIQHVHNDLNNIDYNKNEILIECDKDDENNDQLTSKMKNSNIMDDLPTHYTNLRNETAKELKLISSIITTLKKITDEDTLLNNQTSRINLSNCLSTLNISTTIQFLQEDDQNFLYDLNQLFITQFNIQSASKYTASSIIYCIKKYIEENNKHTDKILKQFHDHKYRYYFTSIIGFFHEHGIGTIVNYYKAYNMYRQAAEYFHFTSNKHETFPLTKNLLNENQLIGLNFSWLALFRWKRR
ncbi:kinase-like protein [Gigaspora margarita]|uniref:Kinase-like protein n=1 Tax=Gigaspora margarita TaxID=4874 RepID=A0A8H4A506_GIGMA|nr:kinase-like protein [Gigaspora margarita]